MTTEAERTICIDLENPSSRDLSENIADKPRRGKLNVNNITLRFDVFSNHKRPEKVEMKWISIVIMPIN